MALLKQANRVVAKSLLEDQKWYLSARDTAFDTNQAAGLDRRRWLGYSMRERLDMLDRISFSLSDDLEGIWRKTVGEIDIERDVKGMLIFDANAAERATARWVCQANGQINNGIGIPENSPYEQIGFRRKRGMLYVFMPVLVLREPGYCGMGGSLPDVTSMLGIQKVTIPSG